MVITAHRFRRTGLGRPAGIILSRTEEKVGLRKFDSKASKGPGLRVEY